MTQALTPAEADVADRGDLARLVISYDTLLRRYSGPLSALCAGDVAEIDAAYDALVASARALAALPPRPADDVASIRIRLGDEIHRDLVERGHASCGQRAVQIASMGARQPADDVAKLREALEEVRDLLMERVYGNPARSPAHNARVKIDTILKSLGAPADAGEVTVSDVTPAGPFHVSRTGDGEKEWFSARDPAAGLSIPARDRTDAYNLVASLNRAFDHHRHAAHEAGKREGREEAAKEIEALRGRLGCETFTDRMQRSVLTLAADNIRALSQQDRGEGK